MRKVETQTWDKTRLVGMGELKGKAKKKKEKKQHTTINDKKERKQKKKLSSDKQFCKVEANQQKYLFNSMFLEKMWIMKKDSVAKGLYKVKAKRIARLRTKAVE